MAKDEKGNIYISEAQSKARAEWEERQQAKADARAERQQARSERTDEEQLARLDKLLGEGVGAKRERARLAARIEGSKVKKETKVTESKQ